MMKTLCMIFVLLFAVLGRADEASDKFLKELQGTWVPKEVMRKGEKNADENILKLMTVKIKDGVFSLIIAGNDEAKESATDASIVIDASGKVVAIDLTPKDGPRAGTPTLGIVKIEKDTVTICTCDPDDKKGNRPTEFSSTKENGNTLIVLKKK